MPSSPRGVRLQSGQKKRTRPYHRPLQKTCVFSVGGDALIAPWGASPERSGKTDMAVPLAHGPMCASAPTKNNVRFQRRGRCPHRPAGAASERPEKPTCPFRRHSGRMKAPVSTFCNLKFPVIVFHTIAYFSFSLFTNRGNCCKIE